MTDYKFAVRHVRFWRGTIQKWSTLYEMTGSGSPPDTTACYTLATHDTSMCYGAGANTWGTYQVECYLASGGTPVAVYNSGVDPESPASWTAPAGTVTSGWSSISGLTFEPVAEVALGVRWQAGVSSTGKAVYFRKWYHAVPKSTSSTGAADVSSTNVTSLTSAALSLQTCLAPTYGLSLGNARRLASVNPIVSAFYENHQMPRGRRRPPLVSSTGRYNGPALQVPRPAPPLED